VLRTVPPLAWLPPLAAFRDGRSRQRSRDFITAIWPVIINTAVGIRSIPQDYRNVAACCGSITSSSSSDHGATAAALHLHRPRIGIGISWLAIVAAEMQSAASASASSSGTRGTRTSARSSSLIYIGMIGFVLDPHRRGRRRKRDARHRSELGTKMTATCRSITSRRPSAGAQGTEVPHDI
jgi:nitrate/nitrite transport system permease protein